LRPALSCRELTNAIRIRDTWDAGENKDMCSWYNRKN
jgi:hypothetical protein